MDPRKVLSYFESEVAVDEYAAAAANLGLWRSEEKLLKKLFRPENSLLELGCGAGRIAFGLHELGYRHLMATDYAKSMIERARHLSGLLEYRIPFRVADATDLPFEDNAFEGAIFGFNGLMQIPLRALRFAALSEILRVIQSGSWFVFTTHDRELSPYQDFWRAEFLRWERGEQDPDLECFGDRMEVRASGLHFMHVPSFSEVEQLLSEVGFQLEASAMRSELAHEPQDVLEFSDDCRFWVVQKPRA